VLGRIGRLIAATVAGALVVAGIAAAGSSYKVAATLNAKQEVPAQAVKNAAGVGGFTGTYVEAGKGATLKWKLTFAHLSGPALQAHIHQGKRGVAGNVIVPLCAPCKNGQTGTSKISAAVIKALEGGNAYVNVHTAKNPAGEIRGQVKVTG
jgi:hypothetical protein